MVLMALSFIQQSFYNFFAVTVLYITLLSLHFPLPSLAVIGSLISKSTGRAPSVLFYAVCFTWSRKPHSGLDLKAASGVCDPKLCLPLAPPSSTESTPWCVSHVACIVM